VDRKKRRKSKKKKRKKAKVAKSFEQTQMIDSVQEETQKVKHLEQKDAFAEGLRVVGLKKTYHKYPFGIKSKKDVLAVNGVYLEVSDNELFALLGHNGAGKSTLFSILTGIAAPTGGKAKICGYDVKTQIEDIRMLMGVVPQFDILWGELTAMEHMRMFAKIKGVPDQAIQKVAEELLTQVGLQDVMNSRAQTFSGGMKRRLSVAISGIGNPKIIFMDEPTTGMDPVSRRDVWELIRQLKKNRTVILTTHAMEEADVLADRIAVIVDGKLKCVGTPLFLKNNFGEGYRITFYCEPDKQERIKAIMEVLISSAHLLDESGGSMVFTVPITSIQELSPLFKLVEQDGEPSDIPLVNELRSLVKECGISHSTLEEVFMKVTGKKGAK